MYLSSRTRRSPLPRSRSRSRSRAHPLAVQQSLLGFWVAAECVEVILKDCLLLQRVIHSTDSYFRWLLFRISRLGGDFHSGSLSFLNNCRL